jgi:SSS family solute:Na+ symporter
MSWAAQLSKLDWCVFIGLLVMSFAFLIWRRLANKNNNSIVEYMVMGRTLTLPMFVTTLVATWYSGIFGVTQISFEHGLYNFITQGFFWYLAAAIFAQFFVRRAKESAALSFSELICQIYGRKSAWATALLIFIKTLPIPYAIAIGLFISGFTGIPLNLAITLGLLAATIYSLQGGMRATILSDVLQFLGMFTAVGSVVAVSYYSFGGWDYLRNTLPYSHFSIQGNHSFQVVIVWMLVAFSTTLLSPVFYQRCFAAKTTKIARTGIYISIGFWVISDILTTCAGMYARAHMPDAAPANAFMDYAINILPGGLRGFFLASIFVTVFSAIDSFLFISSSVISYDLFNKLAHNNTSRNFCIGGTALITLIASSFFNGNIEKVWLLTESFFLACMLLPTILGLTLKQALPGDSIFRTISITFIAMVLWQIIGYPQLVEPFFIGLAINCLCIILDLAKRSALKYHSRLSTIADQ